MVPAGFVRAHLRACDRPRNTASEEMRHIRRSEKLGPKQQAIAFGAWGGTFTVGAVVGPIIGGVLLSHFWWGSVFVLGVPFMVAVLIFAPIVLPEFKNPNAGKLDPASVICCWPQCCRSFTASSRWSRTVGSSCRRPRWSLASSAALSSCRVSAG
jgi:MFS family permease